MDVLVHGITALLVTSPLMRGAGTTAQKFTTLGVAFLSATLLDPDHFVAARSLRIHDLVSLSSRP